MPKKDYTPEQMDRAQRLMDAIDAAPTEKQAEIIRLVKAMILGAKMVEWLNLKYQASSK